VESIITPVFMRKEYTLGKINVRREMQNLFTLSSLLICIAKLVEGYMQGMVCCQKYKEGAVLVDTDVGGVKPWGGHSMYKPSNTCVNGVILRGVLFWESCFFGTVLLCNSLKPSIF
jgi:hypothetical protein